MELGLRCRSPATIHRIRCCSHETSIITEQKSNHLSYLLRLPITRERRCGFRVILSSTKLLLQGLGQHWCFNMAPSLRVSWQKSKHIIRLLRAHGKALRCHTVDSDFPMRSVQGGSFGQPLCCVLAGNIGCSVSQTT